MTTSIYLPSDVIKETFSHLNLEDLPLTACVNKQWKKISEERLLQIIQSPLDLQKNSLKQLGSSSGYSKTTSLKAHGDFAYFLLKDKQTLQVKKKSSGQWNDIGTLTFTDKVLSIDSSEKKFLVVLSNETFQVYAIDEKNALNLLHRFETKNASWQGEAIWFIHPYEILDLKAKRVFDLTQDRLQEQLILLYGPSSSGYGLSTLRYDDHYYYLNYQPSDPTLMKFYCSDRYVSYHKTLYPYLCSKEEDTLIPPLSGIGKLEDFQVFEGSTFTLRGNALFYNRSDTPLLQNIHSFCLNKPKKELLVIDPSGALNVYALPCKQMTLNLEGRKRIQQTLLKDIANQFLDSPQQAMKRFQALPQKIKHATYAALYANLSPWFTAQNIDYFPCAEHAFLQENGLDVENKHRYQALIDAWQSFK